MNEGELLYFTQAELEIMLDLSVGAAHTLYRIGPPPDDDALTAAFTSLYQRGFLTREGDTLSPAPKAGFFRRMGAAPFAVTLKTRYPRPAVVLLYGGGETLWLCEYVQTPLSERVRLRQLPAENLEAWLYDADILEPPFLTREDARELSALREKSGEPGEGADETGTESGDVRLCLEKYQNGGALLGVYEALEGGFPLLRIREEGRQEITELYTVEALRSMLERCFRKDCQQEL